MDEVDAALARILAGGVLGKARQERLAALGDAKPQPPTEPDATYWRQLAQTALAAGEVALSQQYTLLALAVPPPCVRVAPRQYQVGDSPPSILTPRQDAVVTALMSLGGSATIEELRAAAKVD